MMKALRKALSRAALAVAGFAALAAGFAGPPGGLAVAVAVAPGGRARRGMALAMSMSPEGSWARLRDPATGDDYYWNEQTGDTSWEPPVGVPPPPSPSPPRRDRGGGLGAFLAGMFAPEDGAAAAPAAASADYRASELDQEATMRQAVPLAADAGDADKQLLRPLLASTWLEARPLALAYDANEHGWDARAFHDRVDGRGPAIVLARSQGGAVVGGFNPKGWVGLGEFRGSLGAFLFTFPGGDTAQQALKLRKVGGSGLAIIDEPSTGPRFGADGFDVPLSSASPRSARCKLGPYYERRTDGCRSLFGDAEGAATLLTEFKAYVGEYAPAEEIPFCGPDSGIQGIG